MSDERSQVSVNDEYIEKYGFHEVENYAFKSRKGLDVEIVKDISRMKKEPEWMTDFRLRSLEAFYAKPMPNWGSEVLQQIDFPCIETTACAFGGPDLRDLYITTGLKPGLYEPHAGRLFVCRPGAQGVPASAFLG